MASGGLLACAIDRLVGVEKRLPGRINLALGESFGVDFQDPGVPTAHVCTCSGSTPVAFVKVSSTWEVSRFAAGMFIFVPPSKSMPRLKPRRVMPSRQTTMMAQVANIAVRRLFNEVNIAVTGKDLGGCAW